MIVLLYTMAFFGSLVLSTVLTPLFAKIMVKLGKIGTDVHKPHKPKIPESVGISVALTIILSLLFALIFTYNENSVLTLRLTIILVVVTGTLIIGIIDDFYRLSAILKPVLLVIVAIPIILFPSALEVNLAAPIIGSIRLPIIYPVIALLVVSITANSSNMIDVLNGSMSGSFIIVGITAFLCSFIIPLPEESVLIARFLSLVLVGSLLGFWFFNKYPARVFSGDAGSLVIGATVGLIAIYGELEFVLIVAILALIMNSFSILSSIGGLVEGRKIKHRAVTVEDGIISASKERGAPITLVRLLTARKPKAEKELVYDIYKLVSVSCILAIISAFLMSRWLNG